MDWAYSVSDAVAMPQNTISNQAHVLIDETMSFKLLSINLNRSKVWPGLRRSLLPMSTGEESKPQRLINSFERCEMKLK